MHTDDPERAEALSGLIARVRSGDRRAFDRLVGRFQRQAVGYAASLLRGDRDRAEDAVQAAFLEAWRDLPTLRRSAAFAPWLRRIVFKHCDRIRRSDRPTIALQAVTELPCPAGEPAEVPAGKVALLVSALPPGERIAVLLVYVGGCSQRAAARYLGISVGAVKERLHSARRRLRGKGSAMTNDTMRGDPESGSEEWAVDPTEGAVLRREIGAVYDILCRAFATLTAEDVDVMMDQHTDDYTLIFPDTFGVPDWDLPTCRRDLRAAVGTRPAGLWQGAVLEEILAVDREPVTGAALRVMLRMTLVKEGFPSNAPVPRIDSWVRTADGWKMQRTLSLFERD